MANIEIELEVECDHEEYDRATCDWVTYAWKDCLKCKGTGYIPTELGEQILEFVRRHVS